MSIRERLRVKADPISFKQLWWSQIEHCQFVACSQMLESAICATKVHARVPIADLADRLGIDIPEIARLLNEHGGMSHAKMLANCPDDDPAKAELVSEVFILEKRGVVCKRREDRHPYVLTMAFMREVASSNS